MVLATCICFSPVFQPVLAKIKLPFLKPFWNIFKISFKHFQPFNTALASSSSCRNISIMSTPPPSHSLSGSEEKEGVAALVLALALPSRLASAVKSGTVISADAVGPALAFAATPSEFVALTRRLVLRLSVWGCGSTLCASGTFFLAARPLRGTIAVEL